MLAGKLMSGVHATIATEDWGGLRTSHFRLLEWVARDGIRVTDLAEGLGMTKQACGQFVTYLEGTGHVAVRVDPGDRRVRLVVRTPLGDRTLRSVNARIRRMERRWQRQVGPERFATFKAVLEELVTHP